MYMYLQTVLTLYNAALTFKLKLAFGFMYIQLGSCTTCDVTTFIPEDLFHHQLIKWVKSKQIIQGKITNNVSAFFFLNKFCFQFSFFFPPLGQVVPVGEICFRSSESSRSISISGRHSQTSHTRLLVPFCGQCTHPNQDLY